MIRGLTFVAITFAIGFIDHVAKEVAERAIRRWWPYEGEEDES